MPNCRSISGSVWEQARKALVMYFSRRLGLEHSEDLAHDALVVIWRRPDYEFTAEEDFLRVCLGFARNISFQAYREQLQEPQFGLEAVPTVKRELHGLEGPELAVLLDEVYRIGPALLKDWDLLVEAAVEKMHNSPVEVNNVKKRVRLHRARKKLAELTGWSRG